MKHNIKTQLSNQLEKSEAFLKKHKEAIIVSAVGIGAFVTMYFLKEKELINSESEIFFKDLEIEGLKNLITEKDFYHHRAIRDGAAYGSPICIDELRDYLQYNQ